MKLRANDYVLELSEQTKLSLEAEETVIVSLVRQLQWVIQASGLDGGQKPAFSINRLTERVVSLEGNMVHALSVLHQIKRLDEAQCDQLLLELANISLKEILSAASPTGQPDIKAYVREICYSAVPPSLMMGGEGT